MMNDKALTLRCKSCAYIVQEMENIKHELSEKELENYRAQARTLRVLKEPLLWYIDGHKRRC